MTSEWHHEVPALRGVRLAHTRRQLALIAWMVTNMPPGCTFEERGIMAGKLTVGLTEAEERQVRDFMADEQAMRRALNRRGAKPWR